MDVKLVMFRTNGQRKDFPIINPTTVIGRGEDCDLRIPLSSVSRRHCELAIGGTGTKVKDLASSNGTYVNNARVMETDLKAGDRLAVGPVVFTVQVNGMPEEIKPVQTKGQKMTGDGDAANDADVVAQPGASALNRTKVSKSPVKAAAEDDDEIDPIAALQALAGDDEDGKV